MRKPQVYVAGPFRVPSESLNTRRATVTGQHLRDNLGIVVCIPHLSLLEDMIRHRDPDYWLETTLDQMRCCDAVYRIAGYSTGSDGEVAEAHRLGIPVFYTIADLSAWVQKWKEEHESSRTN